MGLMVQLRAEVLNAFSMSALMRYTFWLAKTLDRARDDAEYRDDCTYRSVVSHG